MHFSTPTKQSGTAVVHKRVGETPLVAIERFRRNAGIDAHTPLAYAGRLDPMAEGKLLVLIGDTCKQQTIYHGFDKTYIVDVLFGVSSDSGDVLGITTSCATPEITRVELRRTLSTLCGDLALPYPKFSSKTVAGKPLHTWTLEGRIDEIEIPTNTTRVHSTALLNLERWSTEKLHAYVQEKIALLPQVTDPRKALGADFRRDPVLKSWQQLTDAHRDDTFTIARIAVTARSGTYMRSLAPELARRLGSCGLALHINRTKIGVYQPLPLGLGFYKKRL